MLWIGWRGRRCGETGLGGAELEGEPLLEEREEAGGPGLQSLKEEHACEGGGRWGELAPGRTAVSEDDGHGPRSSHGRGNLGRFWG